MASEMVVFVHRIQCPKCGLAASGYMQVLDDGTGIADCPRCGARIQQNLPPHYVAQLPAEDFNSPVHPHVHVSHFPGLYDKPKSQPRLDFRDLLRMLYSPGKAAPSLYLSTNLQRGMAVVVLFALVSAGISSLITAGFSDVLGFSALDAVELSLQVFITWLVTIFAFLVFATVCASVARSVFGGRGERGMTITLVGYCFPAYVVLSVAVLAIFTVGFNGLDLQNMGGWTNHRQSMEAGVVLFFVTLVGLIWLTWIVSKSVSVANDISMSESVLTSILSAIPAGIIFLAAGILMRLPIGLFP